MTDTSKYRSYSRLEKFMQNFYTLLQTIRIHRDNHKLVIEGVSNFIKSITAYMEGNSLVIKIVTSRLVVEDEILPYNRTTKNLIDNMVNYFNARGLEGVRLLESVKKASAKDILSFIHLLDGAGQHQDSHDAQSWLTGGLKAKNILWAEVIKKPEIKRPEKTEEFSFNSEAELRERARKDYSCIIASFKEVSEKILGTGQVGMRKVVRVVQGLVTHIIDDIEVYTAISTIRAFDDYTFIHSVNVTILSMCMGKKINLSRNSLERLGICALFHDLGKITVPNEILNKAGKLNDSDFKKIEEHSLNSARLIIKLKTTRDRKAKILLPPFEHHMKYDLSGYPHVNWQKPLSLFGRIIAIADVYDAITSPRVYRKSILSPDRALGLMLDGSGKDFDPILIKVFINMLGVYPIGTLLKLNTDELALVKSLSPKKGEMRPLACILKKDMIGNYYKANTIDLSLKYSETEKYVWEIIETYHPSVFGIQPVQLLF
jgi:HD-GYP domain-containing protein (c-di-GMP phosphodiesterase class II)